MDDITAYMEKMLPNGKKYNSTDINLKARQSQTVLLKLAKTDPEAALENLLNYSQQRTVAEFKEILARVKRMHSARFGAIINKFTYQICAQWEYYIVCSGWITEPKAALRGAIDHGNRETVKRLLSEYPEYAAMAIKRAYKMLELDIGELACKYDETFAVGFEIERGICKRILQLHTHGIEPLWEELSHLHTAPLRAGCLPIRFAAKLNNDRAINTLISHEINTKGSEMRDINRDLINTTIAACALFNSTESLWCLITYYYSHPLDGLAAKAVGNKLYNIMAAPANVQPTVRLLSSKYAQIAMASLAPTEFIKKLLYDITVVGNYESWLILFYYILDNDDTFLDLPNIVAAIAPHMSTKMLQVFNDLVPNDAISALSIETKRVLFRQCLRKNATSLARKVLEWDEQILTMAAYYNYNVVGELIILYTANESLTRSASYASASSEDSIEREQMAKLCLSERVRFRSRARAQLDATYAVVCYLIKLNYNTAKQIIVNDYCFYINRFDHKLKSAVNEYGNEEIRALILG
ncbi:hypothetical protein F-VV10_0046 [Faustovirus]|nr:hypothetical protein F-VV10_0046 [Faustovirus]